jgi:phage-related protein
MGCQPTTFDELVFYVATRPEAVYVLHAFEKKTQKTSSRDLEIGRAGFVHLGS